MVKRSEKTFISFRFEAKRKIFMSETKQKKALLISLWSEAKNLKWKDAKRSEKKKFVFFSRERNACETDLVSLRFALKRKIFFLRNRRTLQWRQQILETPTKQETNGSDYIAAALAGKGNGGVLGYKVCGIYILSSDSTIGHSHIPSTQY